MSVYFSKYCLNGYRDHMGVVDPEIRTRLLTAVNELILLGPGLPGQPKLTTRMQPQPSRSRSTRVAGSRRPGSDRVLLTDPGNQDNSLQSSEESYPSTRRLTHGVLKEKVKHKTRTQTSNTEKGKVTVIAKVLHPEVESKTVEIDFLTTSEELVSIVLRQYDAHTKDPNLYYVAMETGIKSKDSGLPISKMIVLENDARPLELQACQPQGQAKFHLKMKSGGLVRVRTSVLSTGPEKSPAQEATVETSDELRNEIEKQNQTIVTLNETIQRLQQQRDIQEITEPAQGLRNSQDDYDSRTTSLLDYCCTRNDDYDQLDELEPLDNHEHLEVDVQQERELVEKMRQRRTSLDALDLHHVPTKTPASMAEARQSSQIDKLRRSFYQFKKHNIDALDLVCDDKKAKRKSAKSRRTSQIEKFRNKFLEYYNVKTDDSQRSSVLTRPRDQGDLPNGWRSWSASDSEYSKQDLDGFKCGGLQTVLSRKSSSNSLCDREIEKVFENAMHEPARDRCQKNSPFLSLFDVLDEMKLESVTLSREPGKEFGLQLAHVTHTGPPVTDDTEDIVYVFHKGDGHTTVVARPTEQREPEKSSSPSCHKYLSTERGSERENEREEVFTKKCYRGEGEVTSSSPSRTFVQWGEGHGTKPRYGVRIVGITKGSIAEETGQLEKDDVIVEVNGKNVLNLTLDAVIATLKGRNNVSLVVARMKETSNLPSPSPSYHEHVTALTEQVEQLVAKVTELQDSVTQKDKTIASLRKSLIKKKLKISSREKIVEAVQVIV